MGNLKKLFIVGATVASIGLTNVNAYNYVGTKKYDFKEFDTTNLLEHYYGFYEYKDNLYVVGNDDKSYKLSIGDKIKLEESDKTYSEHLYELYPKVEIYGISYDGLFEEGQTIGINGEYLNGEAIGAGSQVISGLPSSEELEEYGIINNKLILSDKVSYEKEKYNNNLYFIDINEYKLDKTILYSEVSTKLNITNKNIMLLPIGTDDISNPYIIVVPHEIDSNENIIIDNNITILDYELNKVVSFNTGTKQFDYAFPINDNKFLVELYDEENDSYEIKILNKDGEFTDFVSSKEGELVHAYIYNGFIIVENYNNNDDKKITLYDENLNYIKSYDNYVSINKLVDEESDLLTVFNYYYDYNVGVLNKQAQSTITNDKYLIYSYAELENCSNDSDVCEYSSEIKTMELLTVEDSKTVNITGFIKDKDGNPLKGYTVELHSTVRTVTTDEYGYFKFENVEEGEHTITIKDTTGTVVATKTINVIYGTETKLDGDTLYFNESDNGVNLNLKLDGDTLSIESIDKGTKSVTVPKTFDTLTKSTLMLITLVLSTIIISKKVRKIRYI